jgi:hypothetical protein
MRIQRCAPVFLAAAFVALAGCDASSLAPGAPGVPAEASPQTLVSHAELILHSHHQRVHVVVEDGDPIEGEFQASILVRSGGQARGEARLVLARGPEEWPHGFLVFITGARVSVVDGRTWVELVGHAEVCLEEGERECGTVEMTGELTHDPNDDEPIWQFHVGGVYSSFSAETRFIAAGGDRRGSVRGSFGDQVVQVRAPRGQAGPSGFEADFEVGPDGTALGHIRIFDISDLDNPELGFEFHINQGRFAVSPDGGVIVWVSGILEVVVGGRTEEAGSFRGTVSTRPNDDDPIWQLHGGGVYSGSFEAEGEMTILD